MDLSRNWKMEMSARSESDGVEVVKYRSLRSGLTLVLAEIQSPIIDATFCVKTHPEDDTGIPHALEHLVFQGSKNYKEKGLLDKIAALCYADAPNASTHMDHTRFEISCANEASMMKLLPVYMDHIFHPSLNAEDFNTEVHTQDQNGQESGVMFCELVERVGDPDLSTQQALLRILYPDKNCCYFNNASGDTQNVKKLSMENVRKFHKKFYNPKNVCLVISGKVSAENILSALEEIDKEFVDEESFSKSSSVQAKIPVFDTSISQEITIPTSGNTGDSKGLVYVGWRGPSAAKQPTDVLASIVLLEYLVNEPLRQEFVDTEHCTSMDFNLIENESAGILLFLNGVTQQKMSSIENDLREKLKDLADFHFLHSVLGIRAIINLKIVEILSNLEKNPHRAYTEIIISHFLHGGEQTQFEGRLNSLLAFEKLSSMDNSFWMKILRAWANQPWATIHGKPRAMTSPKDDENLEHQNEDTRKASESNSESFKQKIVEDAAKINLDVSNIAYLDLKPWNVLGKLDVERLGICPNLFQVQSGFFSFCAAIDTSHLDQEDRLYLRLLVEVLRASVEDYGNNSTEFRVSLGLGADQLNCGLASQYLIIYIQVEEDFYSNGLSLMKRAFVGTLSVKSPNLVKIATNLLLELDELSSQPNEVIKSLHNYISFQPNSNHHTNYYVKQQTFLKELIPDLRKGETVEAIKFVVRSLLVPINLSFYCWGNFEKMNEKEILEPWSKLASTLASTSAGTGYQRQASSLVLDSALTKNCGNNCRIFGMDQAKSTSLIQSCPVQVSRDDLHTLAATTVLLKVLSSVQGPIWKQLRGSGLLYGFSLNLKPNEARIYLTIENSVNPVKAYKNLLKLLNQFLFRDDLGPHSPCLKELIEASRRSVIFDLINRQKSIADLISQSAILRIQNLTEDFNRNLLAEVMRVPDSVIMSQSSFIKNLIQNNTATCTTVLCPTNKVESIQKKFARLGIQLETGASGSKHSKNLASTSINLKPFM